MVVDSASEVERTIKACGRVDTLVVKDRTPATRTSARIQKIQSTKDAIRRRQQEEDAHTKAKKPVKKPRVYNKQKDVQGNVLTDVVRDEGVQTVDEGMEHGERVKGDETKDVVVCSLLNLLLN